MRKLSVLTASVLAILGTAMVLPSRAMTINAPSGLRAAINDASPINRVAYCEYFDPALGTWVVFWAPGPCLWAGHPGYWGWIGTYYVGRPYWRGRLYSRPWVNTRRVIVRRGPNTRTVIRSGPNTRTVVRRGPNTRAVVRSRTTTRTVVRSGGGVNRAAVRGSGRVNVRGGGGRNR
jgi:hypothetical protein